MNYKRELLGEIDAGRLQSRVKFTGFMDSEEQSALLQQADIFVLPYDEVGQSASAVLADALAHNRPVVTSCSQPMYAYRLSPETEFSSISTDVSNATRFARVIQEALEQEASGKSIVTQHRRAAMHKFSLASLAVDYRRIYQQVSKVSAN